MDIQTGLLVGMIIGTIIGKIVGNIQRDNHWKNELFRHGYAKYYLEDGKKKWNYIVDNKGKTYEWYEDYLESIK